MCQLARNYERFKLLESWDTFKFLIPAGYPHPLPRLSIPHPSFCAELLFKSIKFILNIFICIKQLIQPSTLKCSLFVWSCSCESRGEIGGGGGEWRYNFSHSWPLHSIGWMASCIFRPLQNWDMNPRYPFNWRSAPEPGIELLPLGYSALSLIAVPTCSCIRVL